MSFTTHIKNGQNIDNICEPFYVTIEQTIKMRVIASFFKLGTIIT